MHFRETNTDASMHFRNANTDPTMHFRKANTEFLLQVVLPTLLTISLPAIHRRHYSLRWRGNLIPAYIKLALSLFAFSFQNPANI